MFKKVLISSGPTIEPIDPVRFISNRSSGKTGYCLAREAVRRKIEEIVFVTGPVCRIPEGVRCVRIETAEEMRTNLCQMAEETDVIIMAAAVCDFKVTDYSDQKIKKSGGRMILKLEKNPDILRELGSRKRENQILVGFAAETENIFKNARKKLEQKNLDLLVLNQISSENPAFNVDFNQVYLMTAGEIQPLPRMKKSAIAARIWDKIFELYTGKQS